MDWRDDRRDIRYDAALAGQASGGLFRRLAQAIAAQAILAVDRHRQACGFVLAPAGAGQVASELGSAAGAGELAGRREAQARVFRICHDLRRSFAAIFMSGSSCQALY